MFSEKPEIFEKKQNRFCEEFRKQLLVTNGEFVKNVTEKKLLKRNLINWNESKVIQHAPK